MAPARLAAITALTPCYPAWTSTDYVPPPKWPGYIVSGAWGVKLYPYAHFSDSACRPKYS